MLIVLLIAPERNGCAPHHVDVGFVRDVAAALAAAAVGAVEDRQVRVLHVGGALDRMAPQQKSVRRSISSW